MDYNFEVWSQEFAANVFGDTKWYTKVLRKLNDYVLNGSVIHIPQDAVAGVAQKVDGSTSLPLGVSEKTYLDKTMALSLVAATPRRVKITQDHFNNIDLRVTAQEGALLELEQGVSAEILNSLKVTGSRVVRTSGSTLRANQYGKANCKSLVAADILAARTLLAKEKANMSQLVMLVDNVIMADLLKMTEFNRSTALSDTVLSDGLIGTIYGIKVYEMTNGIAYTSAVAVPTANYADTYDNTHYSGALIIDTSKVGYAYGEVQVGVNMYATGYYGDIFQASAKVGATSMYADNKGIVAIVETV